jgi:hypothetical protein
VVRKDRDILAMADKFVFLRIVRMNGVDVNLFRFDFDQTWMAFFLSADLRIYARYGGRTAASAEARISKEGLLHAMKETLRLHEEATTHKLPAPQLPEPRKADDIGKLRFISQKKNVCIRCHMINEAFNDEARKQAPIDREARKESFFAYPLPENVGIEPDLVLGNRIQKILPASAAEKAGLKEDDLLRKVNGLSIVTAFDIQYALNDVSDNKVAIEAERGGKSFVANLELPAGWRRWDASWRKSLRVEPPMPGFWGADMNADEKRAQKLPAENLGFRVVFIQASSLADKAGLKKGDVIVAIDGKRSIPYVKIQGYIPLTRMPGDPIEITYLRDGKEQTVTLATK